MNKLILLSILFLTISSSCFADNGWFKKTFEAIKSNPATNALTETKLSDTKIGQGLKETLKVGIKNAVTLVSQKNGYFENESIKILIPEKLKVLDKALRVVGFGGKLDEFVLSMNRAAENAAPYAEDIFYDAIFDLSFADAQSIYKGDATAATEYLQKSTSDKLKNAFRPAVEKTLNEFGVTKQYKEILAKYQSIPFSKNLPAPEIEDYVIGQALNGLFFALGNEEKKIRTDPAARTTNLLKEIF